MEKAGLVFKQPNKVWDWNWRTNIYIALWRVFVVLNCLNSFYVFNLNNLYLSKCLTIFLVEFISNYLKNNNTQNFLSIPFFRSNIWVHENNSKNDSKFLSRKERRKIIKFSKVLHKTETRKKDTSVNAHF